MTKFLFNTSSKIPTDADEISEGEIQDGYDEPNDDSSDEQQDAPHQDDNQIINVNNEMIRSLIYIFFKVKRGKRRNP